MNRFVTLLLATCLVFPVITEANEPGTSADWFTKNLRVLTLFDYQDPARSTQNPGNAFAQLYRYSGEVDLRPDFFADTRMVNWSFKPRMNAFYQWWEDGITKGETDRDARLFVNEWMVRPKLGDWIFVSF